MSYHEILMTAGAYSAIGCAVILLGILLLLEMDVRNDAAKSKEECNQVYAHSERLRDDAKTALLLTQQLNKEANEALAEAKRIQKFTETRIDTRSGANVFSELHDAADSYLGPVKQDMPKKAAEESVLD